MTTLTVLAAVRQHLQSIQQSIVQRTIPIRDDHGHFMGSVGSGRQLAIPQGAPGRHDTTKGPMETHSGAHGVVHTQQAPEWMQHPVTPIPNTPMEALSPEQRQASQSVLNPHGATAVCDGCGKWVSGPQAGTRLGFIPLFPSSVHINDTYCPDCMAQSLYQSYLNRGLPPQVAYDRTLSIVQKSFSPEQIQQLADHPQDLLPPSESRAMTANEVAMLLQEAQVQRLQSLRAKVATITSTPTTIEQIRVRLAEVQRAYGGLNGREPIFALGADGKMHFAGSTGGVGHAEIPGVAHPKSGGHGLLELAHASKSGGGSKKSAIEQQIAQAKSDHRDSVARFDPQLHQLQDATNPHEAWSAFGSNAHDVMDVLRQEPTGLLSVMAQKLGVSTSTTTGKDNIELARMIAERLHNEAHPNQSATEKEAVRQALLRQELAAREALPYKKGRSPAEMAAKNAPTSHDPRAAAYQQAMQRLREEYAPYLQEHPTVAAKHDAATKAATGKTTSSKSEIPAKQNAPLTPIARVEGRNFNITEPLDVSFIHQLYGTAQLSQALSRYTPTRLKEAATTEGINLRGARTKEEIVQRIAQHAVNRDGHIGPETAASKALVAAAKASPTPKAAGPRVQPLLNQLTSPSTRDIGVDVGLTANELRTMYGPENFAQYLSGFSHAGLLKMPGIIAGRTKADTIAKTVAFYQDKPLEPHTPIQRMTLPDIRSRLA